MTTYKTTSIGVSQAIIVFKGGTIYKDAASSMVWVENQVYLGSNETDMDKSRF